MSPGSGVGTDSRQTVLVAEEGANAFRERVRGEACLGEVDRRSGGRERQRVLSLMIRGGRRQRRSSSHRQQQEWLFYMYYSLHERFSHYAPRA